MLLANYLYKSPARYLSPVSTATVATTLPGPSSRAIWSAPTRLRPVDVPAKTPSSFAARRAIARPSSSSIALASSNDPSTRCGGQKPAAVPSTRCGPPLPAVRNGEVDGSSAMMRVAAPSLPQGGRDADQHARRAHRADERIDAADLFDQLAADIGIAIQCVGVVELIGPERVRILCQLGDSGLEAIEQRRRHLSSLARHDLEVGAEGAHRVEFLHREGVR